MNRLIRNNICKLNKNIFFAILGCGIIISYNLKYIDLALMPSMLQDEIGYWAIAEFLNGKDWSGIISATVSYYSYGYSMILAVLIKISSTMIGAYQIAILLNIFLLSFCFIISSSVFLNLFKNINSLYIMGGCLFIHFHPTILHNVQFAWPETMLLFIFWVSIYVLIKIIEKESSFYIIIYAFVLCYMYTIHQRSLGILLVGICFVVIMKYCKKISMKKFLLFCGVLIFLFILHKNLKNIFYQNLWNNNSLNLTFSNSEDTSRINVNNFEGQIGKIVKLFSFEGIKLFISGIIGKVFHLGIATFLLAFEGIYYCIIKIYKSIKFRKISKKEILIVYFLASYLITLIIATIFCLELSRLDILFYGRYIDWVIGPLVLLGFLQLYSCKSFSILKRYLIYIVISFFLRELIIVITENYHLVTTFAFTTPILYFFIQKAGVININEWISFMTLFLINFSIIIIFLFLKIKKYIMFRVLNCFVIIIIYCILTRPLVELHIEEKRTFEMQQIVNYINETDKEVFYVYDTENNNESMRFIGNIQFLLDNKSVKCVSEERVKEVNDAILLLPATYEFSDKIIMKTRTFQVIHKE